MDSQVHAAGRMKGESAASRRHHLAYAPPEAAYDLLTGYAFARRYVTGKTVADVRLEADDPGTQVLASVARHVKVLTGSEEAAGRGRELYREPNTSYKSVQLPALQQEENSFDVVVALQVIEHLESPVELLQEVRRILKPDGVLVLSTPDKQARSNERNRPTYVSEMYVEELHESLQRHFTNVSLRRQGAVAGGFVSGSSKDRSQALTESAQLSSFSPYPGTALPPTELIVAVCSDAEPPEEDESPYLLLDKDRRVFEEDEDHREDIQLLRDEVRRMQETEVQAFYNTLALRNSEIAYLKSEPGDNSTKTQRVKELEAQNQALKRENDKIKSRLHGIEGSNIWRLTAPYRRGRVLLDSWLGGRSRGHGDGR